MVEVSDLPREKESVNRNSGNDEDDEDENDDEQSASEFKRQEIINMQKYEIQRLKSENESLLKVISLLSVNANSLVNTNSIVPNMNVGNFSPKPFHNTFTHGDTVDLTNDCTKDTTDNSKINNKPWKRKT